MGVCLSVFLSHGFYYRIRFGNLLNNCVHVCVVTVAGTYSCEFVNFQKFPAENFRKFIPIFPEIS